MNFYVIKLKHIIIALLIFAVIPIIWFTTSRAVSVFNVNGREIPIYSVERCDNKIALTFDCAWNDDDIDSILDTLDKYNCKATFFVVGDWAEKYSESLKKIYDRGHEIGNHSYNHADYTKMSAEAITADLDKCDGIVESITGERPYLMRAPSGGYNYQPPAPPPSCTSTIVCFSSYGFLQNQLHPELRQLTQGLQLIHQIRLQYR